MIVDLDVRGTGYGTTSLQTESDRCPLAIDFDLQVQRLREGADSLPKTPLSVSNLLLTIDVDRHDLGGPFRTRPLRVALEEYEASEYIARLTADETFSSYAQSVEEAMNELVHLILHDLAFYTTTPDTELSGDAKRKKAMLQDLFAQRR